MKLKGKLKEEKGAMTIIEATFVFPIMLFIVFFMINAGEAYYQHARVEYYVTSAAIDGAARCENPMLGSVITSGTVPVDPAATEVMPYRYILTGEAHKIADNVEEELQDKIEGMKPLLFKGMRPINVDVTVTPHMNPLVSTFPIDCEFEVPLPVRMIFSDEKLTFSYSVNISASVGDPAEFVRTVSTVSDVLERNTKFTEFCGKVKETMGRIGAYLG